MRQWFYFANLNKKVNSKRMRICFTIMIINIFFILLTSIFKEGTIELIRNTIKNDRELFLLNYSFKPNEGLEDKLIYNINKINHIRSVTKKYIFNVESYNIYIDDKKIFNPHYLVWVDRKFSLFPASYVDAIDRKENKSIVEGNNLTSTIIEEGSVYSLGISKTKNIIEKNVLISNGNFNISDTIGSVYSFYLGPEYKLNIKNMYCNIEQNEYIVSTEPLLISDKVKNKLQKQSDYYEKIVVCVDSIENIMDVYNIINSLYGIKADSDIVKIEKLVDDFKLVTKVLSYLNIIILIACFVNLFSIVLGFVYRQNEWIAMLRVMGFRKTDIIGMIVFEVLSSALGGLILSCFSAYFISIIIDDFLSKYYSTFAMAKIGVFCISPFFILKILIICIIACCMIGVIPALFVLKKKPIDVLRRG